MAQGRVDSAVWQRTPCSCCVSECRNTWHNGMGDGHGHASVLPGGGEGLHACRGQDRHGLRFQAASPSAGSARGTSATDGPHDLLGSRRVPENVRLIAAAQNDGDGEAIVVNAPEDDEDVESRDRRGRSTRMLQCLFAMVFSAATMSILNCLGLAMPASTRCSWHNAGCGPCGLWQDVRSMLSFFLGALACCAATHRHKLAECHSRALLHVCLI
eukprot:CAMPEP_0172672438 /NCGR_PEP_ID=MMETSP1074-20121228/11546_1 /TAXON_ID=2916 /ORGANISM="Ceratium fusus, Strain PA161109" /LENGTH=213 /DNA_ID=CAMNT_0013489621 /DNA_START=344 /DNA_END=985 /DNA_ORIENTATION=-